jgi:hypothetical protein
MRATQLLLGALIAVLLVASIEGWVILGRLENLTGWCRQLIQVGNDLLATVPGKSASRTEAPPDVQPRPFWERLRASRDVREATVRMAVELTRAAIDDALTRPRADRPEAVKDGLTPDEPSRELRLVPLADAATETLNVVNSDGEIVYSEEVPALPPAPPARPRPASAGPETRPSAAVIDEWHRDVTEAMPVPDPVDVALSRFDFAEGHSRHRLPEARP